jgi:hypothetical protein
VDCTFFATSLLPEVDITSLPCPSRCFFTLVSKPLCWWLPPTQPYCRDKPTAQATPCRHRLWTRTGLTKSEPTHGRSTLVRSSSVRNGRTSMASGGIKTLPELTQSTIHLSVRLLSERFWFRHVWKVAYQVCDIHVFNTRRSSEPLSTIGCAFKTLLTR